MENRNRTYYTNGVHEVRILKTEKPPEGWWKGRVKSTVTTLNHAWYNNGEIELLIDKNSDIPENFRRGRLKFKEESLKKQHDALRRRNAHWFTDGQCNKQIKDGDPIPENLYRGRTISDTSRIKMSQSALTRKTSTENERLRMLHAFQTRKRNNTFNTSSDEETLYRELCNTHGKDNVIRSYRSDLYPYNCDFYIKTLDKYVELNRHWTHGGMPFDPNNEECKRKLEEWKLKSTTSKFYRNAIQTWTIRDVEKADTAKRNNINIQIIY